MHMASQLFVFVITHIVCVIVCVITSLVTMHLLFSAASGCEVADMLGCYIDQLLLLLLVSALATVLTLTEAR